MKKHIFLLFSLFLFLNLNAQIIITNPAIITNDYNGVIEIVYDASLGTAGLIDYTGTDGIYAHTGVITNYSTSDSDWKHAPVWGDNSAKYKLSSLGNNKWLLLITPTMSSYYGLTTGEIVKKLAFVFRNGLNTKEGKDTGGKDIFVPVYSAGLNVLFNNPLSSMSVSAGTSLDLKITSTMTADLSISVNATVVKSATAVTELVHNYTFSAASDYQLIASATANGVTVKDTVNVCVPSAVVEEALPDGMKQGANIVDEKTVVLVLKAPSKNNVFVIGEFNDWTQLNAYQMKKDGDNWWIRLENLAPGHLYAYQYLVDGSIKISDPYTELVLDQWNDQWINYGITRFPNLKSFPGGKAEGLVATFTTVKEEFNWTDQAFVAPEKENMVIYELLLRDFTPEQTLSAAMDKLDYLQNLGINTIELMPVQEFDGNNSWGYNPNHYFAPDKYYGNQQMYKTFINECHRRGIAVILDIVLNHSTGLHPYAKMYWNDALSKTATNNPWFNVDAPHPYSVFHDYNHESNYTKDFFKEVVKYWLTEYHIDGYRLDLTKGLTQKSSTESTASAYDQTRIDNISVYYDAAKSVKPDVMFILEHFCDYAEESNLASKGMYLWRNLNYAYSQAAMGYQSSSDFGGMLSNPRNWVGYAESHDEERNFFKVKTYGAGDLKTDSVERIARVPLNIAFVGLIPGPKMLWQFEELGYDYSIDSQGGRVNPKPSAWSWLQLTERKKAYDLSSEILQLRTKYPAAFKEGTFSSSISSTNWGVRRLSLVHSDLSLVVLGNFSATDVLLGSPNLPKSAIWHDLLTNESKYYGNTNEPITMNPGDLIILTDRKTIVGTEDVEQEGRVSVFPDNSGTVYYVNGIESADLKLYSVNGVLLKSLPDSKEISLAGLSPGIYILKANELSYKLVKK